MEENWDIIIRPKKKLFSTGLSELIKFKDLLFLLVRRDLVVVYKQTILGPLWFIIQPLLSTITFTFIFGNIAGLSTDGVPAPLFYMSGIITYNYFGETLKKVSSSFIQNLQIFSKVYFPRLIVPVSICISNLVSFFIQMLFMAGMVIFYMIYFDASITPNLNLLLLPLLILLLAILGLAFGIIIAALTTKYKDLIHLVGFGVQLLMYLSPVIYPLSTLDGNFKLLILANPLTSIIEGFRFAIFGVGDFQWIYLIYSFVFALVLMIISLIIFSRIEKTFTDTL